MTVRTLSVIIGLALLISACQKTGFKSVPESPAPQASAVPAGPVASVPPPSGLPPAGQLVPVPVPPPPRYGEAEPLDPVVVAAPPPSRYPETEPRDPIMTMPTTPVFPSPPPQPPTPPAPPPQTSPPVTTSPPPPPPRPPQTTPPPVTATPPTVDLPPPRPTATVPPSPPAGQPAVNPQPPGTPPVKTQTPVLPAPRPQSTTVTKVPLPVPAPAGRPKITVASTSPSSGAIKGPIPIPVPSPIRSARPPQEKIPPGTPPVAAKPPAERTPPATPPIPAPRPIRRIEPTKGSCRICPATTNHPIRPKIDVLFVVDTSKSLVEGSQNSRAGGELAKLASDMPHFVKTLPPETDIRIGVMAAHGPESSHFAQLLKGPGGRPILDSELMSKPQMWRALTSIMTHVPADRAPGASRLSDSQGEAMLLSLFHAIGDPEKRAALQLGGKGLLRPDANFIVIVVTDEQDICYTYPVNTNTYRQVDEQQFFAGRVPVLKQYEDHGKTVLEPDRKEMSAKQKFCEKEGRTLNHVAVAGKLGSLVDHNLTQKVIVNAIAYLSNKGLKPKTDDEDENEMGHGVLDLVDTMNTGIAADMAEVRGGRQVSFADALAKLGHATRTQIEYHTNWECAGSEINPRAIDPKSVRVTILEASPAEITRGKGCDAQGRLNDQGKEIMTLSGPEALDIETRPTKKGGYLRVSPKNTEDFKRQMDQQGIKNAKYRIDFETLRDVDPATGKTAEEMARAEFGSESRPSSKRKRAAARP